VIKQHSLGRLGENIASKYLERRGYKIIEKNYRKKWGELDIVAIAPNRVLVFVEVKTVSGSAPKITGEDQVTALKIMKFKRVAEIYANGDGRLFIQEGGWRMDLIVIESGHNKTRVCHYQNI
jgi:putative endonuclease